MTGLPALTVHEARAILVADKGLELSYDLRFAEGLTFGIAELDGWQKLVESAALRVEGWQSSAPAVRGPSLEVQVLVLREGIETIIQAFGTHSSEWALQLRALLDRAHSGAV